MSTREHKSDILVRGSVTADSFIVNGQFTLPTTDGSANQIMVTDGAGNVTWQNAEFVAPVDSVNGQTGDVVLDTDDISEGSINLYWTQGRFDTAFGLKDTDDLSEGAVNFYYTEARFDSSLSGKTTTDLAEGVNLYWTQGRFDTAFGLKDTDDLSEGAVNFYYTESRFNTSFSGKTTTDLAEGVNLYWTQGRFDTAFGLKDTDDLSEGATNFYYTESRFNTSFSGKTTTDLAEGVNLYWTQARFDAAFALKSIGELVDVDLGSPGPTDGYILVYNGGIWSPAPPGAAMIDELVKASLADTTAGYLSDKLAGTTNKISLTTLNPGANEIIQLGIGVDIFDKTSDDSDDVSEGTTNLYFTDERVDDRVAILIQNGTGITWTYNDIANTLTGNIGGLTVTEFSSPNISQWTNDAGYLTVAPVTSVNTQTGAVVLDTDDISEGVVNLYFTNERVDDRVAALIQNGTGITWTYNDGANTLTGNIGGLTVTEFSSPNVSQWTNDAGYLTVAPVASVNGQTGVVNLSIDDLSDVVLSSPITPGEVLTYNIGGFFENAPLPVFSGAGQPGIVPDPVTATGKFLKDDGTWVIVPGGGDLLSTNNLSDVASALTSFDNIKQSATETYQGVIEIATQAEVDAGIDSTRAVTPATLANSNIGGTNPAFGAGYSYDESDGQSNTTSLSLQTKITMTTGNLPLGTYLVSWYAEVAGSTTNNAVEVTLEDTTTQTVSQKIITPNNASNWISFSGIHEENVSGINTYTLKWRNVSGTGAPTASIRRARIAIWQVG